MTMKTRAALAAVLVLAITSVVWLRRANGDESSLRIVASGTVEATEVDLGFQAPGRIESISVREGAGVSVGDTLAFLDARELVAGLDGVRARLLAANARLEELRAGSRPEEVARAEAAVTSATRQVEEAERNADRAARLHEGGALSAQALDRAQTTRDVARAALDQARQALALVTQGARPEVIRAQEAAVESARAEVARAEAALEHATIVAPISGRVSVRHREPGESVAAGIPVLTILDPADRWVRIYVPEDRIGAVDIGMSARIAIDTYPEREYGGEVVFIGDEAEFTPRNVQTTEERTRLVYRVRVRVVEDPGFDLKPGMPADVTLDLDPSE